MALANEGGFCGARFVFFCSMIIFNDNRNECKPYFDYELGILFKMKKM